MTSLRLARPIVPLLMWAAAAQAQTTPPATPAAAPEPRPALSFGSGKLLLTGGVSSIDGAAGGGLTPWAVTGSYASEGEVGGTAFITRTTTQDYALNVFGAAIGFSDRFELSLARQEFNASVVVPDTMLKLDIVGIKARVAGDAVLDADTLMPQIAVGAQFKRLDPGAAVGGVLDSVAAKRNGVDFYVSATKLFLAQGILVNGTLRATKANQNGLLGFGSADKKSYSVKPEFSLAYLVSKNVAIGAEYRFKPNNLAFAGAAFEEQAWKDMFVAWAPSKNVSVTAAYVDLGNIVGHTRQTGGYVSAQLAF